MSTAAVTMTRERRSSSSSWIKMPRLARRRTKRETSDTPRPVECSKESPPLHDLPVEILIKIISYLELDDLLALRGVDRTLNALITSSDSDVAKFWVNHRFEYTLRPQQRPGDEWQFILHQHRRWQMCATFADVIREYIQYKTFLHANAQRNLRFAPIAQRIQDRLIPLLFTLSVYLSQMKTTILDLAASINTDMECQQHMDAATIAMLGDIPLPDLKNLHHMWLFLNWLLNSILSVPTYAGTIERTVRGWTALPLDRCTLAKVLIFGNVAVMHKLVKLRDYKERRKCGEAFLRQLNPDESTKWRSAWTHLDVGLGNVSSEPQARKALAMDIDMPHLWYRGAETVLERAGSEHVLTDEEMKPSSMITVRFLADLAGYDLFHAPVPHDFGNDDDESARSSVSSREGSTHDGQQDRDRDDWP